MKVGTPVVAATILDDDSSLTGVPMVAITDSVVDEKAGRAYFTVTLDRPSTSPVSLTYRTAQGTAEVGVDYQGHAPQTLAFAPGERAKTVAVNLVDDGTREDGEYFDLLLSEVSGALLPDTRGRAFIGPSDQPASATPVVSVADAVANESTGYAEFVFRLDAPQSEPVSVQYATLGGSAKGYQSKDNDFASFGYDTLTFAAGETVKTARVGLFNDGTPETAESFHLALVEPYGANVRIGTGLATATILDDQSSLTGLPSVSITDEVIDEKAGLAYFTVALDRPSSSVVTVTYQTADGTAIAGADYQGLAQQTLAFAPGERAKTVAVNLIDDGTQEATEYFDLVLSGVSGASMPVTRGRANIGPSDQPVTGMPVVSVADIFANESDGFAEFVFRLDAPAGEPTSLHYATRDGSATQYNQNDYAYINVQKTLTFAPGEMVKTARVALVDDTTLEGPENFYLDIFNGTGLKIGTSWAIATIEDDESQVNTPPLKDTRALTGGNLVYTMARFARAAYSLRPDEPRTDAATSKFLNDPYYSYDGGAPKTARGGDPKRPLERRMDIPRCTPTRPRLRITQTPDPYDFHTGIGRDLHQRQRGGARRPIQDALVIRFEAPTTPGNAWVFDPGIRDSPDQDDWIGKNDHWKLYDSLDSAISNFLLRNGEVKKVYVTGHSLGAAMVSPFWAHTPDRGGVFIRPSPRITWLSG